MRWDESATVEAYLWGLVACLLLIVASPAFAQLTPSLNSDTTEQTPPPTGAQTFAHILNILEQVTILRAGRGFNSIELGDTFAQLQDLWGDPQESKKTGLLKQQLRWRYQLDDNAVIEFTGKPTISSISVYGNRNAIVTTDTGLGFRASREDIQSRYGALLRASNKLDYPALGIRFIFDEDQLNQIDIYSPETG